MSLKLSQLDEKLRRRIESQLAQEDAARRGDLCPVPTVVPQSNRPRKTPPEDSVKKRGKSRVVISIIGLRRRALDDDNFNGGCKALRDCIAASLGIDDGDKRLLWQYSQLQTRGREGVLVRIEVI